ncbi:DUF3800 domain-containing protein [Bradyrhizobium septentrionale]|uniref:DUF3800 domain-containing protein n=1 Tax=Bradyrhizobium septentrionale TaxID=1404411 RepID=UPI0030CEB7D1
MPLSLYLDDSGTRNPDRKRPEKYQFRDWFTLGGYTVNEEDEGVVRTEHAKFCEAWGIKYPLHSYDIRATAENFKWLGTIEQKEYERFMGGLGKMLLGVPVIGHACVIDRPGYNERYRDKYGRQTWMLCQTAFAVVCERAAKQAIKTKRKLRVYVEEGDKLTDNMIRDYYKALREKGMPFDSGGANQYAPLTQEQLHDTLYDLDFKAKSSPMAQIADLYAYPLARGGYDPEYSPYQMLRANSRVIDDHLTKEEIPHLGIKYSCFEVAIKSGLAKKEGQKTKRAGR